MYVCVVITYSRVQIIRRVANPVHGQLNREKFPCLRSRLKIWFRETDLAVPSVSACSFSILKLNLVLPQGIPPNVRSGVHIYLPPYTIGSVTTLSSHAIAYRWRSLPRVRCVQTQSLLYCCCSYCGPVFSPRLMSVQASYVVFQNIPVVTTAVL